MGIEILLALFGPLLGIFLLVWVFFKESEILRIGSDSQAVPNQGAAMCSATLPLSFCQAITFITCYTVARILAAKRTYHGGGYGTEPWEVFFILTGFVLLYLFQAYLVSTITSKCNTVLSVPPFMSEENKKMKNRIGKDNI